MKFHAWFWDKKSKIFMCFVNSIIIIFTAELARHHEFFIVTFVKFFTLCFTYIAMTSHVGASWMGSKIKFSQKNNTWNLIFLMEFLKSPMGQHTNYDSPRGGISVCMKFYLLLTFLFKLIMSQHSLISYSGYYWEGRHNDIILAYPAS